MFPTSTGQATHRYFWRVLLLFALCTLGALGHTTNVMHARAQASPDGAPGSAAAPTLRLIQGDEELVVSWREDEERVQSIDAQALGAQLNANWKTFALNGYLLPAVTLRVGLPDDTAIDPRFELLESEPWSGELEREEPPVPVSLAQGDSGEEQPALVDSVATLPSSPLLLLREGRQRGERVVILIFSPFFQRDSTTHIATAVRASLPNARLIEDAPANGEPSEFTSAPLSPLEANASSDPSEENSVDFSANSSINTASINTATINTATVAQSDGRLPPTVTVTQSATTDNFSARLSPLQAIPLGTTFSARETPFALWTVGGVLALILLASIASALRR